MTILADIGEGITIVEFTQTPTSDYGDLTTTGSSVYSVTARVNILNTDSEEVKSGILQTGDARGYFEPNDFSKLKAGNIVEYQSLQYVVKGEPMKHSIGGTANHVEVLLERYHKP